MKRIVCVSDLQIPFHDPKAVTNLAAWIKATKPDMVLSVGDEMDMQTISRWSKGTPLEYERSIARDRDETVRVLESLRVQHVIRSNHTDRLFNTVMMRAPGLLGLPELSLPNFLRFDQLGITYHRDPWNITIDGRKTNWFLMHGDEGSLNRNGGQTALGLAKRAGVPDNGGVVCGHTHRMGLTHHTEAVNDHSRTVWGMEVGTLMSFKSISYIKGNLHTWAKGFGILDVDGSRVTPQLVPIRKDGTFVVDGRVWGK
jgi:predicted phosphodiesterase